MHLNFHSGRSGDCLVRRNRPLPRSQVFYLKFLNKITSLIFDYAHRIAQPELMSIVFRYTE